MMLQLISQIENEEVANYISKWTDKQKEGILENIFEVLEKYSISKELRDKLYIIHLVINMKSFEIGKNSTFIKQLSDILRPDELKVMDDSIVELNKVVNQFKNEFIEHLQSLNLTPDDQFEIQSLLLITETNGLNEGVIQSVINSKWPQRDERSGFGVRPGGW